MDIVSYLRQAASECDAQGRLPEGRHREIIELILQTVAISEENVRHSAANIAKLEAKLSEADEKLEVWNEVLAMNELLMAFLAERDLMGEFREYAQKAKNKNASNAVVQPRHLKLYPGGKN